MMVHLARRVAAPHNDEAEMALLGALLHSHGRALDRVAEFLAPEHFASRVHGRIFRAIRQLVDRNQVADPITLKQYFDRDGDLVEIGGYEYLMRLAGSTASIANTVDYGRTIRDLALRRSLIVLADDIAQRARADDIDDEADAQVLAAEARLAELARGGPDARPLIAVGEAAQRALETIDRAMRATGLSGITTGLGALDRQTGGLRAPDLVIVGGRTGMGKSGFAGTIALAAARAGATVLFFSLEMSAEQLGQRFMAAATGISTVRQRKGALDTKEFDALAAARAELDALTLLIDETGGATLGHLRTRARQHRRRHGLDLVIVDYLQLVRPERRTDNRVADLTEISGGLKRFAKDMNVPVIALSQLSRAVENRDDKRPRLSDLRESGSIEQDADSVWFCYRPAYYDDLKPPAKRPDQSPAEFADALAAWRARNRGEAQLIGAKERHGGPFTIACRFDGPRTLWCDAVSDGSDGGVGEGRDGV
jgi:replicative DNA helicase